MTIKLTVKVIFVAKNIKIFIYVTNLQVPPMFKQRMKITLFIFRYDFANNFFKVLFDHLFFIW